MSIHLQKPLTIQKAGLVPGALHTGAFQSAMPPSGLSFQGSWGSSASTAPLSASSMSSSLEEGSSARSVSQSFLSSTLHSLVPSSQALPLQAPAPALGGLHVFKPRGPAFFLPATPANTTASAQASAFRPQPRMLRIQNSAYEKALSHLTAFAAWFEHSISPQAKAPRMAWLSERHALCAPYPPAFESRGLALENILFLESDSLLQSTQQLCEDDFFDVLVLQCAPQPVLLKIAHRWLSSFRILPSCADSSVPSFKPSGLSFPETVAGGAFLKRADALEGALHTRLFLFLE